MAKAAVTLNAGIDGAWTQLQQLATWEGVAGIEDLREPTHDAQGDLSSFRFTIDTSVGRIDGQATVEADKPKMVITGSQKGLEITIALVVTGEGDTSQANIEAYSKATKFLAKPLELALNALLDSGLDDEAAKIAARVN